MPTFLTTSGILAAVLRFKGWNLASSLELADFALGGPGRVRALPLTTVGRLTSKKAFTRLLGQSSYLPRSYTSAAEVPADGRQLWFIKGNNGASQREVFAVRTREELTTRARALRSYVIQQGVSDLDLYHGYKYTVRGYLLLLKDGRSFFYRRMLVSLHDQPYNPNATDHGVQVGCDSHDHQSRLELRKMHAREAEMVVNTLPAMREVAQAYQQALSFDQGEYHLFGIDLLFDTKLRPWVLEINAAPSLRLSRDTPREDLQVGMLLDFYELFIGPRIVGSEARVGEFVLL